MDEVAVIKTGTAGVEDDVSLNRKEVFSDEVLKVFEMSFKVN